MKVIDTKLQDVKIIEMAVFGDHRGFFTESYTSAKFKEAGIDIDFIQDNHSLSVEPGVLRGMHFQYENTQDKLVRVVAGSVYDVVVDLRYLGLTVVLFIVYLILTHRICSRIIQNN